MKRASGKIVVITGGNSGIGKGVAQKFLQEGARVVIFGRDQKTLDATQQELGGEFFTVQGDVLNTQDLQRLFAETKKHFGKIDVLVANAGVAKRVAITEITEKDFDTMVDINYRGLFFTVRYALDFLKEGASILLIGSIAAHITVKHHAIYSSTKAAVVKLAQNFAFDLSEKKIRVNSISPGYIETPIFDERIEKEPNYLKTRQKLIPLNRIGTPEDIANAVLFLSSDEASYITGADLVIDGGYAHSLVAPD